MPPQSNLALNPASEIGMIVGPDGQEMSDLVPKLNNYRHQPVVVQSQIR